MLMREQPIEFRHIFAIQTNKGETNDENDKRTSKRDGKRVQFNHLFVSKRHH